MASMTQEMMIAYLSTNYRVGVGSDSFVLKIGIPSPEIMNRLRPGQSPSGVFITAFNPLSDHASDDDNACAQFNLLTELQGTTAIVTEGFGEDPLGRWPGEESYFVAGLDAVDAAYLALRFRQHAFVWIDAEAIPILVCMKQEVDDKVLSESIEEFSSDFTVVSNKFRNIDSLGRPHHPRQFPNRSQDSIDLHTLQSIDELRSKSSIDFLSWLYVRHNRFSKEAAARYPEYAERFSDELAIIRRSFRRLVRDHIANIPADRMKGDQWE